MKLKKLKNLKKIQKNGLLNNSSNLLLKTGQALKANYETNLYKLELEIKSQSPEALRGLEQSFAERKKKLKENYEAEDARLEKLDSSELAKEMDKRIAEYNKLKEEKRTYSSVSGTMWIMDFMLPENSGKGATKFYFGTNSHVAKGLTNKTTKFSVSRLNENVGVGSHFRLNDLDDRFTRILFW
nr:hypothetical protein [Mycoplasmopsis bovis]